MNKTERDKVYRSTKEALAGNLRQASREVLGRAVWNEVASPNLNYALKKPVSALKGMPVSQAILDAMTQQCNGGGLGGRKPREVMFYCLDYLQNAKENQATSGAENSGVANIDKVMDNDMVEIYNEEGRWKLRVIKEDGTSRMEGFLFPPATVEPAAATVEPAAATVEPAAATVEPAAATVEPAAATVEPAPETVEPAAATVEPAAATVEPAPATVEPAAATVEPAAATVEPAPETVEPAAATVEPAAATVEPAPETVEPAPETVEPAPETVEPAPETVEPAPETVEPAAATVEPAAATVEPAPETVEPAPETVEPAAATVEPAPETVEPAATTVEPAAATVEPAAATVEPAPETVEPAPPTVEPAAATVEPAPATVEPAESMEPSDSITSQSAEDTPSEPTPPESEIDTEPAPPVPPINPPTSPSEPQATSPESQTDQPVTFEARDSLDIPQVSPERLREAQKALQEAYSIIKTEIYPKLKAEAEAPNSTYEHKNGLAMLEALLAKPFNPNDYLPLMIKESRLDPKAQSRSGAKGLFQIMSGAQAEVKMYYGYKARDLFDPTQNAVAGILFLHRCREHYATHPNYGNISKADRDLLAHAIYNKGHTNISRIWKALGAKSFEEFERGVSTALRTQLKPGTTATQTTQTVLDPNYNVDYVEYDGVQLYLEAHQTSSGNRALDKSWSIGRTKTGITFRKAGEVLRYTRLIEGIEAALEAAPAPELESTPGPTPGSGTNLEVESPQQAVDEEPSTLEYAEYTVKAGDGLWRIGREFGVSPDYLKTINGLSNDSISEGQTLKVPAPSTYDVVRRYGYDGFSKPWIGLTPGKGLWSILANNEDYNRDLGSRIQVDKRTIVEVVLDYNARYNPELMPRDGWELANDGSNLPKGVQIWVPNADYFIAYQQGDLDRPEPNPEPSAEPAPQAPPETPPTTPPEPAARPDEVAPEVRAAPTTELPPPPEFLTEISEALDKRTPGQYVRRVGNQWVRDVEAMRAGAERFEPRSWGDHPRWDARRLGNRRLVVGGQRVRLENVKFIVLHSTASENVNYVLQKKNAHFAVERDGTIRYVVPVKKSVNARNKAAPHAGPSVWAGVRDLNRHSIGIEVAASAGTEWTEAQYEAVRELTEWLGGYFGLEKRDVVLHKQIAYSSRYYQRGRKSDPYDNHSDLFRKLGLPDNSKQLDIDMAQKRVHPHKSITRGREGHRHREWEGYSAAVALRGQQVQRAPVTTIDRAAIEEWKQTIEQLADIKEHTVASGDTLYNLAQRYNTGVEHIMAYNDLQSETIQLGQVLKIPSPKE